MFSKLIIATTLLLVAGTAQADWPLEAWLKALRTEHNIHNAEQWIGNFAEYLAAPGNETLDAMAELMDTDNFLFSLQPRTVSNTLVPWASFAPVSNYLIGVLGGFTSFNVTYRADPVGNVHKVVLFPESTGMTGLKGAYEQQYVVSLSFNDDGKIDLYEEFVDSLYTCGKYGSALSGCPPLSE